MTKILNAKDVMLHLKENKSEIEAMVANKDFDYIRVSLDKLIKDLENGGSKKYDDEAIMRLGDFIVMLPDDIAFSLLKDLVILDDLNCRLFLKRLDVFDVLKRVRKVNENVPR